MKQTLNINLLCREAKIFSETESNHNEPLLFGITDGKAVGTYLEHKFQDYLNKNYLENNLIKNTVKTFEDKKIVENRKIIDGRVNKVIKIKREKDIEEYFESVKLYTYTELIDKFSQIGFNEYHVYGDYFGSNYNEESSERCIIIFQK